VEWTIHWLDLVLLVLDVHLIEHIIFVKIEMARGFPQVQVCNMRSVDNVIPSFFMRSLPKVFNNLTNFGSFGVPEDKTATGIFLSD
jgi:hypothetical protein